MPDTAKCLGKLESSHRGASGLFSKRVFLLVAACAAVFAFGTYILIHEISRGSVEYVVMRGESADIQGMAELPLSLPKKSEVAFDSAYTEYLWEDFSAQTDDIRLLVTRKSNSKRRDVPPLHDYKMWLRRRIETGLDEITKLFPKKIHATNFGGFILKISLFLFAYQIYQAFIL